MALHGEQEAAGIREDLRGGRPKGARRELRFSDGVNYAGLCSSKGL